MMEQYQAVKRMLEPDAVLLMRMGDFYEVFGPDAARVASALELVVTHRNEVPMTGIPAHALEAWVAKLARAGIPVAIAEPAKHKGKDPAFMASLDFSRTPTVELLKVDRKTDAVSREPFAQPITLREVAEALAATPGSELMSEKARNLAAQNIFNSVVSGVFTNHLDTPNKVSRAAFEKITGVKIPTSLRGMGELFRNVPFRPAVDPSEVQHVAENVVQAQDMRAPEFSAHNRLFTKLQKLGEYLNGPLIRGTTAEGYSRKDEFHEAAVSALRDVAAALGYKAGQFEVRSNKGGVAVTGEITLHTTDFYLQLSETAWNPKLGVMFRAVRGLDDYGTGTDARCQNQWMKRMEFLNRNSLVRRLRALRESNDPCEVAEAKGKQNGQNLFRDWYSLVASDAVNTQQQCINTRNKYHSYLEQAESSNPYNRAVEAANHAAWVEGQRKGWLDTSQFVVEVLGQSDRLIGTADEIILAVESDQTPRDFVATKRGEPIGWAVAGVTGASTAQPAPIRRRV